MNEITPVIDTGSGYEPVGKIVSITGSQAIVMLDSPGGGNSKNLAVRAEMGTLLKVETPISTTLGLITALSVPAPAQEPGNPEIWIAELELVGELVRDKHGVPSKFRRGVSVYPSLGDPVIKTSRADLELAYSWDRSSAIKVGTIRQDANIPAMVRTDELLGKHFAILGTTGTGKSCTVALILRKILEDNPQAHIVLLDPHNEYSASFGEKAEVVTTKTLQLPYWFLTFEEIVEVLIGDKDRQEKEIEILSELIPVAKARYAANNRSSKLTLKRRGGEANAFSVDTPIPYRISDVLDILRDNMGSLELKNSLGPYKRLKTRIEALSQDPRYSFMFGALTVQDQMVEILGRLFRVPVNGKPITIMQLTGLPSEVVNVVVSVLARMTFDFALWSDGKIPVTLVCEEAHRYIPNDPKLGFEPTRRAIARIAKEGRKYGTSLCIVSQRPSELDPTITSQCNTIFVLRMSNEADQKIVSAAVSDAAASMLEFLPSLGTGEAIAFGDAVPMPVSIKFDMLPEHAMPKGGTARFSEKWSQQIGDKNFLSAVVERWRQAGTSIAETELEFEAVLDQPMGDSSRMPQADQAMAEPGLSEPGQPQLQRRAGDIRRQASAAPPPPEGQNRSLRSSLLKKPLSEIS